MTTSTLSLGPLVLVATQDGPLLRVSVSTPTTVDAGTLCLTIPEWSSLAAVVDALAAGERRHAEDRKEIERLRGISALNGEWINHTADTEIALRENVERFRDSMYALERRVRELTEQRDAAVSAAKEAKGNG